MLRYSWHYLMRVGLLLSYKHAISRQKQSDIGWRTAG